jgi:hypothetical protein
MPEKTVAELKKEIASLKKQLAAKDLYIKNLKKDSGVQGGQSKSVQH